MKRAIYIIIGFAIAALIIMPTYYYSILNTPASRDGKPVTVTIKSGASFPAITRTLMVAGVLKNEKGFKLAARIKRAHRSIKAGEYELSSGSMTPLES